MCIRDRGTTAPVGVEDVMCPSNAISASECNVISPPTTSRCLGTFNAAGVRCTQGMFNINELRYTLSTVITYAVPDHTQYSYMYCLPPLEDANVTITTPPEPSCLEFGLRLTNTSFPSQPQGVEGNVEICINGTYFAICDLGWDDVEAQLACNVAGVGEPLFRKIGYTEFIMLFMYNC